MKMKRSKIFKIKNQDLHEDTAFEREFRVAVVNHNREKRDEKIILLSSIVVMFAVSILSTHPIVKGACEALVFVLGVFGIIL